MNVGKFEKFKGFDEFSNYHKISRLSNGGLKIGNLAKFIMLFSFLGNHFVLPLIFMTDMVT